MTPSESAWRRMVLVSLMGGGIVVLCFHLKSSIDGGFSDNELLADATNLVQETFSNLPADHPIIRRHGNFVSMPPGPVTFHRIDTINVGVTPIPGCLIFELNCQFAKHVVPVEIAITKDQSRRLQVLEMLPLHESDFDPTQPFKIRISMGAPGFR